MILNLVGPFVVNAPFGTEIAFAKGLKKLGHEVNEVDPNIDHEMVGLKNTADATLVFKSCVGHEKYLRSLTHPVIVYQPDDARFPHIREMMLMMRKYADYFLSFDEYSTNVARSMGYLKSETLLLTADSDLYCHRDLERDIDISFIGSLGDPVAHSSRRSMLQIAQRAADTHGWSTHFEVSQDIDHVVDIYNRSKVVLNHATDVGQIFATGFGLQCRHFEVGMTKTCLLTNKILDWKNDLIVNSCKIFDSQTGLVDGLFHLLNDNEDGIPLYKVFADRLYREIQEKHMPEHRASQLITFIEGLK